MNSRVLIAALAGAVVYFFLGWLFYHVLLQDFILSHSLHYPGFEKAAPILPGIFVSGFAYTLLMAIVFGYWADISTAKDGVIAGTTIGLLIAISLDLGFWSMYNYNGKQVVVADILVQSVMGAIIGAVIARVLGYKKA